MEHKQIAVPFLENPERLDLFLAGVLNLTRARVKNLIDGGYVFLNGMIPEKAGVKVKGGENLEVTIPDQAPSSLRPEAIPLEVIFEDEVLLALNKPPGLVVHPAAGHWEGTLVNALLHHFKKLSGVDPARPGIVHRLDKETSGLLVVAKNDRAHLELSRQLKDREVEKYYAVLVHGHPLHREGRIEKPIGRHPKNRKKMAVISTGRQAVTTYQVVELCGKCAFLKCRIETGRTHQIRVHLSSLGHPVVGDETYGRSDEGIERQMLHAWKMKFKHPLTGEPLTFEAPLPQDFLNALELCREKRVQ